ncbi:hypothetical protein POPTR_005G059500v4 [Populus trichocarpa]|uniref:Glycoside hydrolase n=1 Tax=Populus trichocarpa TaxID=3694 RepID=U5GAV2_POPTR|nr:beta-glucosidase 12 [Populus trichocarpa]PNT35146.1 hypothetical protein POPTR_005G059500v4 [Populus trichocarpa]|eukprot:XP_006382851.1 beta-glucosidase 12 [Populus trichocarpa]
MAIREMSLLLGFLVLLSSLAPTMPMTYVNCTIPHDPTFSRNSFPDGFVFGTGSAAYQYEGHANKSNRGPSIWDTFTHDYPARIKDHSTGDVAIDFYDLYKDDIRKMKDMHMDAFRFSISWTRMIPSGQVQWGINDEGIEFYNNLIDEIILNGLVPYATLFHWDTPQALFDKYGGFLSENIVNDFRDFADLCFQSFGDRVKHWFTLNEPDTYSVHGFDSGVGAPGRCSAWVDKACQAGDSATEPYIVTHNLLRSHAAAVKLYREKYQEQQNGKIGITLCSFWYEPYSETPADYEAVQRILDFNLGWHLSPITYGDYPRSMRSLVGDRLPNFTAQETSDLRGSYDILGLNYYGAYYAKNLTRVDPDPTHLRYATDSHVNVTGEKNGKLIGPQAASPWLYVYPKGIRYLLNYTKDQYRNPTIYITENGVSDFNNGSQISLKTALNDTCRAKYYHDHLKNVLRSIENHGTIVKGYFAWTFADDFEWPNGYTIRFGLYYTDYQHNLHRYPKRSVQWFTNFLKGYKWNKEPLSSSPLRFSSSAPSDRQYLDE